MKPVKRTPMSTSKLQTLSPAGKSGFVRELSMTGNSCLQFCSCVNNTDNIRKSEPKQLSCGPENQTNQMNGAVKLHRAEVG